MIYAQISKGVICNTIVADENTPLELFSEGFDYLLRIDNLDVNPGIGWSYDGDSFLPPLADEGKKKIVISLTEKLVEKGLLTEKDKQEILGE